MTDWNRYRKCPVCAAGIGEQCLSLTGVSTQGVAVRVTYTSIVRPHGGRQLRTGGAR